MTTPRRAAKPRLRDAFRVDLPPMRAAQPDGYTLSPHGPGSFPGCCWRCDMCPAEGCAVRPDAAEQSAHIHIRAVHGNEIAGAAA